MPTCDKYLHLLKGNVMLVEEFWPEHPKVFIMGFKKPNFEFPNDKWEFVSIGEDKGKNNWTNDIIEFFRIKGDEIGDYFYHMNDDAPPLRRVKHEMMEYMFEYMKTDLTIGKMGVSGNLGMAKNQPQTNLSTEILGLDYKIAEVKPTSDYRLSITNDIWKKSYFNKYLVPNLSSWGWETRHVKNDGFRILTTHEAPPTVLCHLYRISGTLNPYWYSSRVTNEILPSELAEKYGELTNLTNYSGPIFKHPTYSDVYYNDKKPWPWKK